MKVAVYTLTRDRLKYTQHCFETLQKRAGCAYDHFVLDNGSADGTQDWLRRNVGLFKHIHLLNENVGISAGSNRAIEMIQHSDAYDLIIKMDNDCEVISENMIGQMVEIFSDVQKFSARFVLSPRVEGIVNQPTRARYTTLGGRRVGITGIVGGLFLVASVAVLCTYRYDENLPLAWGQDDMFCKWFKSQGGEVGYVEGLVVNHFETTGGQAERYPDYFKRKWAEEKRE